MSTTSLELRLAGTVFDRHRHVCAFFNSKEEEFRVLLPFVREGLAQGHKSYHVVDPGHRAEHLRRLEEAGIDVTEAEANAQLEVKRWDEAYLRNGRFNQDQMLALIEEALSSGRDRGYPLTRLWANMEWSLEDRQGVEDIVEYETRLNYILPKYEDPVICTYDLSRFDATVVMDIMRTHPMVLIGGIMYENPFFVPPEEMLQELRARNGGDGRS